MHGHGTKVIKFDYVTKFRVLTYLHILLNIGNFDYVKKVNMKTTSVDLATHIRKRIKQYYLLRKMPNNIIK